MNFMLDGKNSAELTNLIGSGNPNLDAIKYIKPELLKNPAIFPDKEVAGEARAAAGPDRGAAPAAQQAVDGDQGRTLMRGARGPRMSAQAAASANTGARSAKVVR